MSTKPLLIYHANCTDGFGANFFAQKYFHDKLKMARSDILTIPAEYRKEDQILETLRKHGRGRDVYIMDFSFSPEVVRKEILPISNKVVLLDHHKTAMEQWTEKEDFVLMEDNLFVKFDMKRSGALLAWEHFFASEPYERGDIDHAIAEYISDWDLFKFEYGETTRFFNAYLKSIPMTIDGWNPLNVLDLTPLLEKGKIIRETLNALIAKEVTSSAVVPIEITIEDKTYKGLSLNMSSAFVSEVGNALAQKEGTFALLWKTNGTTAFCSLRSVRGYDCSKIATHFGGGGHPNASGFSIPLTELISMIKNGIR